MGLPTCAFLPLNFYRHCPIFYPINQETMCIPCLKWLDRILYYWLYFQPRNLVNCIVVSCIFLYKYQLIVTDTHDVQNTTCGMTEKECTNYNNLFVKFYFCGYLLILLFKFKNYNLPFNSINCMFHGKYL